MKSLNQALTALATALVLFLSSTSVFAHVGHGNPNWMESILHYFIEPGHLWVIVPAVLTLLFAVSWARKKAS